MKTIDVRELQKTTKEKRTKTEMSLGNRSYSKSVRAKWFCCAFKLGFLQLICKASLIFKSNLELVLSIILKQRELYESFFNIEYFQIYVFYFVGNIILQQYYNFHQTCVTINGQQWGSSEFKSIWIKANIYECLLLHFLPKTNKTNHSGDLQLVLLINW